jgi:hypothetical protein
MFWKFDGCDAAEALAFPYLLQLSLPGTEAKRMPPKAPNTVLKSSSSWNFVLWGIIARQLNNPHVFVVTGYFDRMTALPCHETCNRLDEVPPRTRDLFLLVFLLSWSRHGRTQRRIKTNDNSSDAVSRKKLVFFLGLTHFIDVRMYVGSSRIPNGTLNQNENVAQFLNGKRKTKDVNRPLTQKRGGGIE